ncbi:MAG TPA: hypothetical protein VGE40_00670 [Bacilli bacterium]
MENALQTYELKSITVIRGGLEEILQFESAVLVVDTTFLAKSWFIDVSYMKNLKLLKDLSQSSNIKVDIIANTMKGYWLTGEGYIHPNLFALSAAIKGEGTLEGYDLILL